MASGNRLFIVRTTTENGEGEAQDHAHLRIATRPDVAISAVSTELAQQGMDVVSASVQCVLEAGKSLPWRQACKRMECAFDPTTAPTE